MPSLTAKVATGAPKESESQGSPQDTSQARVGVFVGLISDQSHTFCPFNKHPG